MSSQPKENQKNQPSQSKKNPLEIALYARELQKKGIHGFAEKYVNQKSVNSNKVFKDVEQKVNQEKEYLTNLSKELQSRDLNPDIVNGVINGEAGKYLQISNLPKFQKAHQAARNEAMLKFPNPPEHKLNSTQAFPFKSSEEKQNFTNKLSHKLQKENLSYINPNDVVNSQPITTKNLADSFKLEKVIEQTKQEITISQNLDAQQNSKSQSKQSNELEAILTKKLQEKGLFNVNADNVINNKILILKNPDNYPKILNSLKEAKAEQEYRKNLSKNLEKMGFEQKLAQAVVNHQTVLLDPVNSQKVKEAVNEESQKQISVSKSQIKSENQLNQNKPRFENVSESASSVQEHSPTGQNNQTILNQMLQQLEKINLSESNVNIINETLKSNLENLENVEQSNSQFPVIVILSKAAEQNKTKENKFLRQLVNFLNKTPKQLVNDFTKNFNKQNQTPENYDNKLNNYLNTIVSAKIANKVLDYLGENKGNSLEFENNDYKITKNRDLTIYDKKENKVILREGKNSMIKSRLSEKNINDLNHLNRDLNRAMQATISLKQQQNLALTNQVSPQKNNQIER